VRGGGIKVKLWNKNSALGDLGRWRRMFVELQERGKPGEFDHQTTMRCVPTSRCCARSPRLRDRRKSRASREDVRPRLWAAD